MFIKFMYLFRNNTTIKNEKREEYDVPKDLELLNKWNIPRIEPRTIYQFGTFENIGLKNVVKTVEKSVPMEDDEICMKLLCKNEIDKYVLNYKFMHIGLIQIALKPLTLNGLPESFIAVLRDARNLNWRQSLMGIMQSSLAYGPVYFNVRPNLQLSLSDRNILEAVTLYVKTHGYNYMPGTETICICYRIYFKVLHTLSPNCRIMDNPGETIMIESNLTRSQITTRRMVKWEEIELPESWKLDKVVPSQPRIESEVSHIEQTPEGNIYLEFRKPMNRASFSSYSVISPISDRNIEFGRASTSQIRDNKLKGKLESDSEDNISPTIIDQIKFSENRIPMGIKKDEEITPSEMSFKINEF